MRTTEEIYKPAVHKRYTLNICRICIESQGYTCDIAAAQVLQMLEGSDDPTVAPFAEAAWELFGPAGGGGGGSERELGLLGGALMAQWRRDAGVPAASS